MTNIVKLFVSFVLFGYGFYVFNIEHIQELLNIAAIDHRFRVNPVNAAMLYGGAAGVIWYFWKAVVRFVR